MSKIEITVNRDVNKKVFVMLFIFSFILFCAFTYSLINTYGNTLDYVKVDAVITEVGYDYMYESDSYDNYVVLEYYYNDISYTYKQRVAFRFNKKVGNKTSIYVNSNKPNEVRDKYYFRANLCAVSLCLLYFIFMIPATIKRFKM